MYRVCVCVCVYVFVYKYYVYVCVCVCVYICTWANHLISGLIFFPGNYNT